MRHKMQIIGTLLVILSSMLYGLIGLFGTKLFAEHFSIVTMSFWRFLIASLCMLCMCFFSQQSFISISKIKVAELKYIFLTASFYAFSSSLFFLSTTYIHTGPAMVIFFSFPVFIALYTWKLNDWQMDKFVFAAVVAIIIGLWLLRGQGATQLNFTGIFIGLVAAIGYACYLQSSKISGQFINAQLLTLFICVANMMIFFVLSIVTQSFIFPHTLTAWLYLLTLSIIATALPIQLMIVGLKYVSSIKAAILSLFEPIITIILGVILLHEKSSGPQLLGIAIIMLAGVLIQFERSSEV